MGKINHLNLLASMRLFLLLTILIGLTACSNYSKLLKNKNYSQKYTEMLKYFNKNDFDKTIPLLEQLREHYRYKDSIGLILMYSAKSYYGIKDYEYAQLYFKDYVENFPKGLYAEECAFYAVKCVFNKRQSYELDQTDSKKGVELIQEFVNKFPNSEYINECNAMMDETDNNVKKKEVAKCRQYYLVQDYRATVVSVQNTISLFPDLKEARELESLMVESQYLYAKNSIDNKKLARYTEAKELSIDFIKKYGENTSESKKVKEIQELINKNIFKIKI